MADSIDRAVGSILDDMIPQSITRLAMFSMHSSFAADVPSLNRATEIAEEAAQMAGHRRNRLAEGSTAPAGLAH